MIEINEIITEKYIKISLDWIGKNNNGKHLIKELGVDALYLTSLIMFRYMFGNESRFTFDEAKEWFGYDRRCVLEKMAALDRMKEACFFDIEIPYKNHYRIYNISSLLYPIYDPELENFFTVITESEMNKILSCKTVKVNRAYLFAIYITIKSYLYQNTKIGCPKISTLVKGTTISNKTVLNYLKILMELELIYYTSRGWDKKEVKNIGNVYTLWSLDAAERVKSFIVNDVIKKDTS